MSESCQNDFNRKIQNVEILIAMILIPGIALLMMYANGQRQHGLDRDSRQFAQTILGVLSVIVLCLGVGFGLYALIRIYDSVVIQKSIPLEASIAFILRCLMAMFLIFGGWSGYKVSRQEEQQDLTMQESATREQNTDSFRVGLFVLICLPLLVPGSFGLMVFSMLAAVAFSFVAIVNHARANRLLWTLALAAKHNMNFQEEVDELALTEKGRHRDKLRILGAHLSRGTTLSHALLTGHQLLPFEYASAIQVGEETDTLNTVLPALAIKHSQKLKNFHTNSALNNLAIYAFFVTAMVFNVTAFIMYWIIPKFKQIFQDFGIELPAQTVSLINFSDFVLNYWFILLPLMFLPLLTLFAFVYVSLGYSRWIPKIIYRLFPRLATPQVLRTIGHIAEYGGSIPGTVATLTKLSPETGWTSRFRRVGIRIEQGEHPGKSLYGEGWINRREASAIDNAQQLGHLPWAMQSIADKLDKNRINRVRNWSEVFKPIVILALGMLVFFFAIGMFLPLVKMLNDLS